MKGFDDGYLICEVGYGVEIGVTAFTSGDDAPRDLVYIFPENSNAIGMNKAQAHAVAHAILTALEKLDD